MDALITKHRALDVEERWLHCHTHDLSFRRSLGKKTLAAFYITKCCLASPLYRWANWGLLRSNYTQTQFKQASIWRKHRGVCGQCVGFMSNWKENDIWHQEERLMLKSTGVWTLANCLFSLSLGFLFCMMRTVIPLREIQLFMHFIYAYRGGIMHQALML